MACTECHGELRAQGELEEILPKMSTCVDCHEVKKEAPKDCLSCHLQKKSPSDHGAEAWMNWGGHGLDAKIRAQDCAQCHTSKTECTSCHFGMNGRAVHQPNFRMTHGVEVNFQRMDCAACHQPVERFCADCHDNKRGAK